ncbi:hypothetical protein BDF19DRAFT_445792 [Syncephalis fuscata]|nr:hypothetical protein BDF19DRAFT_445792 [Syncephalis fuscata]
MCANYSILLFVLDKIDAHHESALCSSFVPNSFAHNYYDANFSGPYNWICSDSRINTTITKHINAENDYANKILFKTELLQKQLFDGLSKSAQGQILV